MTKYVKAENGMIHEFPDEATSDQIAGALKPSVSARAEQWLTPSDNPNIEKQSGDRYPAKPGIVNNIEQMIKNQFSNEQAAPRTPQMQERYSNPAQMPEFADMSKQEKMQRLALSAFDPANRDAVGAGQMAGGGYENDATRQAATMLPTLAAPEISGGNSLLMRYLGAPAINAMSRIGVGTAGNAAYAGDKADTMDQFKTLLKNSLGGNALLEAGTAPIRGLGYSAEMLNPVAYTSEKMAQIRNEYHEAREAQRAAYAPVTEQYGHVNVTNTPRTYLNFDRNDTKYFTPEVKKVYGDFLDEPTFDNLHRLQSQMGKDAASMTGNSSKINTRQTLESARDRVQERAQTFLSRDPEALASYNRGRDITRDVLKPYEANINLRRVAQGNVTSMSPNKLRNEITKGVEKGRHAIPENHPLQNHLRDLNKMIDFGGAIKDAGIPLASQIGALALHPDLAGAFRGLEGGALTKFALPSYIKGAQNPLVRRAVNVANPLYYGAGRTEINALNQ